jgi:hypothetical protein
VRGKFFRNFGVRGAKTAGGIGFRLVRFRFAGRCGGFFAGFGRFRRIISFGSGGNFSGHLFRRWTRATGAGAATTTATSATPYATAAGTARCI